MEKTYHINAILIGAATIQAINGAGTVCYGRYFNPKSFLKKLRRKNAFKETKYSVFLLCVIAKKRMRRACNKRKRINLVLKFYVLFCL